MTSNNLYIKIERLFAILGKVIAFFLIFCINLIRPMLGPMNICPFTIGCTQYALLQLHKEPVHRACINIFNRLIQCHPFGNRKL